MSPGMGVVERNGVRLDPMGDPPRMSDPVSARIDGVATVLASPNIESISSRRTPQVSG